MAQGGLSRRGVCFAGARQPTVVAVTYPYRKIAAAISIRTSAWYIDCAAPRSPAGLTAGRIPGANGCDCALQHRTSQPAVTRLTMTTTGTGEPEESRFSIGSRGSTVFSNSARGGG
jgi:hypothetical protein